MRRKTLVIVSLLVVALMVASTVPVGAKKPPKDPPCDGSGGMGTINNQQYDEVDGGSQWTMDASLISHTMGG
jgi:hypothetical protein